MDLETQRELSSSGRLAGRVNVKNFLVEYGIVVALVIIVVTLSTLSEGFMTVDNIFNVLRQISINAILAIGSTFVILTAGIDLSVGSVVAFSGMVAAAFASNGQSGIALSIFMGLMAGLALGAINGVVIAKWRVSPFIVTLGMMSVARGATFVYSDGQPKSGLNDAFLFVGGGQVWGIPFPVIIVALLFIIFSVVLYKTRFGRYVFAVGGNENSAKISGIRVDRVKIIVYAISGLLAGMAGIILASRVSAGLPQAGLSYELDAIAAVVIGGTSLMGGRGRLWGSLVGALLIGILNNGLDLLNVSSYWQQIVKGCIIVAAVMIDRKK